MDGVEQEGKYVMSIVKTTIQDEADMDEGGTLQLKKSGTKTMAKASEAVMETKNHETITRKTNHNKHNNNKNKIN